MSTNPLVLPVAVTDALSKAVAAAVSPEEIRAAVIAEAEKQASEKQATEDATAAAAKKKDDDAAAVAATQTFKRTVSIGGKDLTFESASELELERKVNQAYSVAFAIQPTPVAAKVEPVVPVVVSPTEEEKIAAAAELELKFKRGEINTAEYLEQSGAVDSYLEKKGVPISKLKATVEQSQTNAFEHSWAQATDGFLKSPAGADWPGGEQNKKILGLKLAELGLVEAEDKIAAMSQAYAAMKSEGLVFPASSTPTTKTAVATPAAAAATPAAPAAASSSSLFGASSGAGASTETRVADSAAKYDIPANATPQEIIDAWKKEQIRLGKDPNAAFNEAFRSKK